MQILLVGSGSVSAKLNLALGEHQHEVVAQLPMLNPNMMGLFTFKAVVVVSPESSVTIDALVQSIENGKGVFVVAGESDPLLAWANSANIPSFPYPLTEVDQNRLLNELRQFSSSNSSIEDQYRRAVLGGDMVARIQSGMVTRKIAITSPKGGTGKTTIATNLAVFFALSGLSTFVVDADGNGGSMAYHLRLGGAILPNNLIGLLRKEKVRSQEAISQIASSAAYLSDFYPIEQLPTLRFLPGVGQEELGHEVLQDYTKVDKVIADLYQTGVAANGVSVMDVGINVAHPIHRAALKHAENIVIVIKPEIPDLAYTLNWIKRFVRNVQEVTGSQAAAYEFIGSRVKICYNQVVSEGFQKAHNTLRAALSREGYNFELVPNGIIPLVPSNLATDAVNSDRVEDILIWRSKIHHPEELQPFTEALVGFATHFVPTAGEAALRIGLVKGETKKIKRTWFGIKV